MDNITQTLMRGAGGGGGSAAPTDPNFKQVALLLHGDGTNGSQNNTFLDSSTNNFSITRNGNTTQGTYSPFSLPDGQWSNFFDGTGDYLSTPNNSAFQLGSGDFTIEAWVYPTVVPSTLGAAASIISLYDTGANQRSWALQLFSSSSTTQCNVRFGVSTDGTTSTLTTFTGGTITRNSWFHIAAVRSGNTITVYVNGTSVATNSYSSTLHNATVALTIGRFANDVSTFTGGYISNSRVVKGTAVYTSNFTPSTTPLTAISGTSILTCQSNRFVDNSSNNFTLTRNGDVRVTAFSPFAPTSAYSQSVNGGSGYFDGSGDYLTVADNANLRLGTDPFTVEAWIYVTALNTALSIAAKGSGTTAGWVFQRSSANVIRWVDVDGTNNIDSASMTITNAWVHVAIVREGTGTNQTKIYVNGQLSGQGTISRDYSDTNPFYIGVNRSVTNPMLGYIADLRVVKGTAVYTTDFTPPTAPVTNITNTSLLLNFTNAGIFDNASKFNLETLGNAQIDTTVKQVGTGSLEFDGTGDYLRGTGIRVLPQGREPFTIECWARINNNSSVMTVVAWGTASTNQSAGIQIRTNGVIRLFHFFNDLDSPTSTVTSNIWYHIAAQYDGTTRRIFVDGVQVATSTSTTVNIAATDTIFVGSGLTAGSDLMNGYIDDLRITKGIARYTASGFTPPSAPYPDL